MNSVLELRQYKIVPDRRDAMIDVFERHFIESQEAVGAHLVGQFTDRDDPNRFTWIRGFTDMETRERSLSAFYFGPVWEAHRDEANPLLLDNDNVLLLKPLTPDLAFADTDRREPPAPADLVVATIFYLWKDAAEGFDHLFAEKIAAAGLPTLGVYVPETRENTFPRLPVRQHEKVLVWFSRADCRSWLAADPELLDAQERPAQVLRLDPTPRSRLR